MDWGVWFAETVNVNAIINGLGLGALAFLFATDRILTKGQHERRVADLERAHQKRIEDKDAAHASIVSDLRDARDHFREGRDIERDRAEAATTVAAELARENAAIAQQLVAAIRGAGEAHG